MKTDLIQGFFSQNKKIIFLISMKIQHELKNKKRLGRKHKTGWIEQITLTLFKLKYHLPDRVLEDLFAVDHVTMSRIINRISIYLEGFHLKMKENPFFFHLIKNNDFSDSFNKDKDRNKDKDKDKDKDKGEIEKIKPQYLIVDSTVCAIGKGKTKDSFSGYKHHHGAKFQIIVNENKMIETISSSYPASYHDKKVFLMEYKKIEQQLKESFILGDKAYIGLTKQQVEVPIKRNQEPYKNNKEASQQSNHLMNKYRVKIEHVFAEMKSFRILKQLHYYSLEKINRIFYAVGVICNLRKFVKMNEK